MKQLTILILTLCLLTSCAAPAPAPPEPTPQPTPEPTPVETEPQPSAFSLPQPVLETSFTDEPARYRPTPTIVPLVNARRIYTNCVLGETTFIRAADQSRVELPPNVFNYAVVRAWEEDNALLAYGLIGDEELDYRMAFMSVDGEMLSDFIYDSFGEDYIHFPNRYGYVVILRDGGYGLLNLATGTEVIPPEYDGLQPYKYGVVAQKGENYLLLDYAGRILFEFGSTAPYIHYDDEYIFSGTGHTFLLATGEIFSHTLQDEQGIHFYGGMTIELENYRTDITIYNQWQEKVFTGSGIKNYYCSGGAVLLTDGSSLVNIITQGSSLQVEIPEMPQVCASSSFWFASLAFGSDLVTLTYEDEDGTNTQHTVIYDLQGTEQARFSEYGLIDTENHIRLCYAPDYSQQLEDFQGNIIIPFGKYDYINTHDPFIVGIFVWDNTADFDILSANGELLLHKPLGAITYESGLPDSMVVWLDEQTCVFLYPDGSTVPIADPPQVELIYIGG